MSVRFQNRSLSLQYSQVTIPLPPLTKHTSKRLSASRDRKPTTSCLIKWRQKPCLVLLCSFCPYKAISDERYSSPLIQSHEALGAAPQAGSLSHTYANLGKQAKRGEEASSRLQWGTGRGSGNQDLKLHHWGKNNAWVWRGINRVRTWKARFSGQRNWARKIGIYRKRN